MAGLQEARKDNEYTTRWYKRPKDRLSVNAGLEMLANHGRRAFRYLRLVVPKGAAAIAVQAVQATWQHYPVAEAALSPAPTRNSIRSGKSRPSPPSSACSSGTRTASNATALWISDYRVEYLCNALLYGDRDLARKCLLLMAASQFPDG